MAIHLDETPGAASAASPAVAAPAESPGFGTIDLGPSRYAREIEGMLIPWMNARLNGRDFDYHLRRTPE